MLFLALLCGRLAEYGLDYKIESDREVLFNKTMNSDLKNDTTIFGKSIIRFKQKGIEIDSLINLLNSKNIKWKGVELYYFGRIVSRFDYITSTNCTIQHMKNSGDFPAYQERRCRNQHIKLLF